MAGYFVLKRRQSPALGRVSRATNHLGSSEFLPRSSHFGLRARPANLMIMDMDDDDDIVLALFYHGCTRYMATFSAFDSSLSDHPYA